MFHDLCQKAQLWKILQSENSITLWVSVSVRNIIYNNFFAENGLFFTWLQQSKESYNFSSLSKCVSLFICSLVALELSLNALSLEHCALSSYRQNYLTYYFDKWGTYLKKRLGNPRVIDTYLTPHFFQYGGNNTQFANLKKNYLCLVSNWIIWWVHFKNMSH